MAYLTLFCRKFPKKSRKKSQRSGREGGGLSRLGQIPNFYRKFVLRASLIWPKYTRIIQEHASVLPSTRGYGLDPTEYITHRSFLRITVHCMNPFPRRFSTI